MTRVMVHELDADTGVLDTWWAELRQRTTGLAPELLVLPEMPFAPWLAARETVEPDAWRHAADEHAVYLDRFEELEVPVVVTTRPVVAAGARYNEGLVWLAGEGIVATRRKTFLPDEPGFLEATWYERGPVAFPPVATPVGHLGVMICTELWFPEHARALGQAGVGVIAVPRATPVQTVERWEAGARVLATLAGAYCLSVNRAGGSGPASFQGGSVIVDPEGRVLARTTPDTPVAIADIDLSAAVRARCTYPRYVDASPL